MANSHLKLLIVIKIHTVNNLQSLWWLNGNPLTSVCLDLTPSSCIPKVKTKLLKPFTLIDSLMGLNQWPLLSWACKDKVPPVVSWTLRTECLPSLAQMELKQVALTLIFIDQRVRLIKTNKINFNSRPRPLSSILKDSNSNSNHIDLLWFQPSKWLSQCSNNLPITTSFICREACLIRLQLALLKEIPCRCKTTLCKRLNSNNKCSHRSHQSSKLPWQLLWQRLDLLLLLDSKITLTEEVPWTMKYLPELNWRNFPVLLIHCWLNEMI